MDSKTSGDATARGDIITIMDIVNGVAFAQPAHVNPSAVPAAASAKSPALRRRLEDVLGTGPTGVCGC